MQHLPHWRRGWVTSIRGKGVQQEGGHAPLRLRVRNLEGCPYDSQGKQALRARVNEGLPSKHALGTGGLPH